MPKALIISDNSPLADAIENEFSLAGWASDVTGVSAMMVRDVASKRDLQCVVLVVDKDFRKRYGATTGEMNDTLGDCSKLSPIYLIFEGDYESSYSPWLEHTKRLFKSAQHQRNLQDAINEIVRLESELGSGVPFAAVIDSL